MTDEEILKKLRRMILADSPKTKAGKRRIVFQQWPAREVADELGISMQKLRRMLDAHGDRMFKTATVYYEKSERTGGASSPVQPWTYSPGAVQTWPAMVVVEPRESPKKLKEKLLR